MILYVFLFTAMRVIRAMQSHVSHRLQSRWVSLIVMYISTLYCLIDDDFVLVSVCYIYVGLFILVSLSFLWQFVRLSV